jgi:hypothetical protein
MIYSEHNNMHPRQGDEEGSSASNSELRHGSIRSRSSRTSSNTNAPHGGRRSDSRSSSGRSGGGRGERGVRRNNDQQNYNYAEDTIISFQEPAQWSRSRVAESALDVAPKSPDHKSVPTEISRFSQNTTHSRQHASRFCSTLSPEAPSFFVPNAGVDAPNSTQMFAPFYDGGPAVASAKQEVASAETLFADMKLKGSNQDCHGMPGENILDLSLVQDHASTSMYKGPALAGTLRGAQLKSDMSHSSSTVLPHWRGGESGSISSVSKASKRSLSSRQHLGGYQNIDASSHCYSELTFDCNSKSSASVRNGSFVSPVKIPNSLGSSRVKASVVSSMSSVASRATFVSGASSSDLFASGPLNLQDTQRHHERRSSGAVSGNEDCESTVANSMSNDNPSYLILPPLLAEIKHKAQSERSHGLTLAEEARSERHHNYAVPPLPPTLQSPLKNTSAPRGKREWLLHMNQQMSLSPIGHLNTDNIAVSTVVNGWAKLKTAEGARMVDMWLERLEQEHRAGNTTVSLTGKMYTVAVDAWAKRYFYYPLFALLHSSFIAHFTNFQNPPVLLAVARKVLRSLQRTCFNEWINSIVTLVIPILSQLRKPLMP